MDRNTNLRLNLQRYEQHLSSFGKKVLQELIKQWDKARHQNIMEFQFQQFPSQYHKRVISFNDYPDNTTPYITPIRLVPCKSTYVEENSQDFNLADIIQPAILSSVELIKNVPTNSDNDDFVHPTIAANRNLIYDIYNKESDAQNTSDQINITKNKSKAITWDDMLDSELLMDITINQTENKDMNDTFKISNIRFDKENVNHVKIMSKEINTITCNENNGNKGQKRKVNKSTNSKTKKVRNEVNMVENQIKPIESAKQNINMLTEKPKSIFRKQKYTKTIKNWLNNVEAHNPIEEDININSNVKDKVMDKTSQEKVFDKSAHLNKNLVGNNNNISIENKIKVSRKVVQAQLANKEGVMKYGKPKTVNEDAKKDLEVKENQKDSTKEKKVKKFVAPIKYQVPVKDISYEICAVNENNIENYADKLQHVKNNEIIAVLIYSNGFCQLNRHHTDDKCAPDGIIINHDDMFYCFKVTGQKLKDTLRQILENNKVVCYGARNILIYLESQLQMEINSISMYDTEIGASLLDPDNSPENFTDLQKLLSFTAPYTIVTECMLQKTAWYMSLLKDCWAKLYGMLVEDSLWNVFLEIEMKLLPVIADMERRGVLIDFSQLKVMEEALLTRMKVVEQLCYKAAGKVFQINSTVQVRAILYDELQLDTKCNVKIRETICKGAKSTSETMLRSLMAEHPLPKLILEYRHLHKAHATFLTGIAQHVKDGIVRPTWVQTAAATGRIASNNPNLQAIPKTPFSLVMFPEANFYVWVDNEHLMFRSVYVSREGHSFLAADFKHVECRVFAHAAADTGLLNTLATSDDLFRVLAAKWLKKSESDVVPAERERTKRLVYASLYGAGTRKLMEILDVSYEQALEVAASFNRTFPSLKWFGRGVVARCSQWGGRLATLCGRVRRFHNIDSEHFALKSQAERQAVNFIVQGSAADLCKIAMILTEERLRSSSPPVNAHLVLQIHDELVWEVKDQDVDRAAVIIKQVMEGCSQQCGMAVPLPVAISVGKSWGHMEDYTVHI